MPAPLILFVEDEADIRELFAEVLRHQGYRVASAVEFREGAALLRASRPALLITNVRLPNGNGRDLEKLARAMKVPVLLISAHPQDIDPRGDIAFLQKPFRLRVCRNLLAACCTADASLLLFTTASARTWPISSIK